MTDAAASAADALHPEARDAVPFGSRLSDLVHDVDFGPDLVD